MVRGRSDEDRAPLRSDHWTRQRSLETALINDKQLAISTLYAPSNFTDPVTWLWRKCCGRSSLNSAYPATNGVRRSRCPKFHLCLITPCCGKIDNYLLEVFGNDGTAANLKPLNDGIVSSAMLVRDERL